MMTTTRLRVNKPVYRAYFARTFAFTLLFAFLTELAYSAKNYGLLSNQQAASAGGGPVSDIADGMVDLYTGDFRYSVPLLSVPGPNGENVSLNANYAGGIRMNQSASWIGLGWDLNPGEITRQVVGVPDDFAGQYVLNAVLTIPHAYYDDVESNGYPATHYFGPVNYDKLKLTDNHSLPPQVPSTFLSQMYKSDQVILRKQIRDDQNNGLDDYTNLFNHVNLSNSGAAPLLHMNFNSATFRMAAYDNYYVSGPGISGKLKPYLLSGKDNLGPWYNDNVYLTERAEPFQNFQSNAPNYKRMQFHFEHSNKLNFNTGTTYSSSNDNYMPSSTFVRYYKNSEINTASNLISSSVPGSPGFLDFQIIPNGQSRRDASFHDPDAIGGIQVTDASGLTYHYSLPVFSEKHLNKQLYATQATADYLSPSNAFQKMTVNYQHDHYASSWKLTAVTGRDYIDKNGNKIADEGDEGYWVQYKYSVWQSDFLEGSNYFNYGKTFSPKFTEAKTIIHKSFVKTYYISNWETQKLYLDFIRTASHTAYFIKDTRWDNHSFESSLKANESVSPELRLTRIVLLKNSDKGLIENSAAWGSNSMHSRFISSLFTSPQSPSLIHTYKYMFNKSAIDAKSLASVEFETDYSLCKGYHRNVNNSFNATLVSSQGLCSNYTDAFYKQLNYNLPGLFNFLDPANTGFTSTNLANSGKLTLKAIHSYVTGGAELFDPVKFDYDQGNALKNPNYNPDKVDFWGYYKSDASNIINTSNYATPASAQHVDAWSLKTITTSLGANIQIEYEADVFEREGFVDKYTGGVQVSLLTNGVNKYKPHLFKPIIDASGNYQSIWFTSQYLSPDYTSDEQSYATTNGYGLCNVTVGSFNNSSAPPYTINRFTVLPIATHCQPGTNHPVFNVKVNYLGYGNTGNGNFNTYFNANYGPGNLPLMENGFKTWLLNIYNSGDCINSQSGPIPYDYTVGMGFTYIILNKMVGGGTRVKSIQVKENESGSINKKEYTYTDGYCKVVPRPFMYAPVVGGNFYELWDNNDMVLPYYNASGVGYSKVETKNSAVGFSNLNNGKSVYTFNNDPILNPVLCAIRGHEEWVRQACKCLTPAAHQLPNNTDLTHNSCAIPIYRKYVFDATFNDEQEKKQGLLIALQHFDASNKEVYKQTTEYDKHSILEKYYVPNRSIDYSVLQTASCFGWHSMPNSCNHTEEIQHMLTSKFNYYYPTKITETVDGLTSTRELEYDPVSGFIRKTKITSPGTPLVEEEIQYAYEVPSYSALGSKSQNINNYNMMSVPYSKKIRKGGVLISETRTENLKNRTTRIRLEPGVGANSLNYYYSYLNDQTSANTNPDIPVLLENWEKPILNNAPLPNQTITSSDIRSGLTTLFDKRGHVLEAEGLNGRKSATRYGYNTTLPLSTISNAGYNSFAFSSFEDLYPLNQSLIHFGGEVSAGHTRSGSFNLPNNATIIKPHSGDYLSKVPAGQNGPEIVLTQFDLNRTYEAKVWVHNLSSASSALRISLSGVNTSNAPVNLIATVSKSDPANIIIGDWTLMRVKLTLPSNLYMPSNPKNGTMALSNEPQLKISLLNGSNAFACFDDLMVHPIDAAITGAIYDEQTYRLKASINSEGLGTYFYYDAAGRLTATFGESEQYGLRKLSENEYNNCKSFLLALPNSGNSNGGTQ